MAITPEFSRVCFTSDRWTGFAYEYSPIKTRVQSRIALPKVRKAHHVGLKRASKSKKSVTIYVYAAFETMAMRSVLSTLPVCELTSDVATRRELIHARCIVPQKRNLVKRD